MFISNYIYCRHCSAFSELQGRKTGMKILVAEDEEGIALTYELALRARGHEVTITTNGKLCVDGYESRSSKSESFDVVILDYRMPLMDGYEAAKRILKVNPAQRIIFASAFAKETLEGLIKNNGIIAEILQKPFDLDILVDTVEDSYIYSRLQALKVNVGDLKAWNPGHQELSDLLDALLRLKDPSTVFSRILHEEMRGNENEDLAGEKAGSHGAGRHGHGNKDSRVITAIVEDALGYLGSEWLSIFFYHLDHLGVQKQQIANNPEKFIEALDKLLGNASAMVKLHILKSIESNQDVVGQSDYVTNFKKKLTEVACNPPSADAGTSSGGRGK